MKEYIEREATINTVYSMLCRWDTNDVNDLKNLLLVSISELPAADVVEVRHGRWTDHRTIEHDGEWYCTACGEEVTICSCGKDKTWKYRYCPNCGARMDGGAK